MSSSWSLCFITPSILFSFDIFSFVIYSATFGWLIDQKNTANDCEMHWSTLICIHFFPSKRAFIAFALCLWHHSNHFFYSPHWLHTYCVHMASLSGLLFAALTVVMFFSVLATNVVYNVTFLSCVPGSTCPQGNPSSYNRTFALNGTLRPNLTLKVGDRLEFDLAQNVPNHPLAICQNSTIP